MRIVEGGNIEVQAAEAEKKRQQAQSARQSTASDQGGSTAMDAVGEVLCAMGDIAGTALSATAEVAGEVCTATAEAVGCILEGL